MTGGIQVRPPVAQAIRSLRLTPGQAPRAVAPTQSQLSVPEVLASRPAPKGVPTPPCRLGAAAGRQGAAPNRNAALTTIVGCSPIVAPAPRTPLWARLRKHAQQIVHKAVASSIRSTKRCALRGAASLPPRTRVARCL